MSNYLFTQQELEALLKRCNEHYGCGHYIRENKLIPINGMGHEYPEDVIDLTLNADRAMNLIYEALLK